MKGFTITEMLMVVAILIIITAISLVAIGPIVGRAQTRDDLVNVAGMLKKARSSAARTGTPHTAILNSSSVTTCLDNLASGSCSGPSRTYNLKKATLTPAVITFNPSGYAEIKSGGSIPLTIDVASNYITYHIRVYFTGRIES